MKNYNILLVSAGFIIATIGAVAGQGAEPLTTVYGKTTLNQCLLADPSTMEFGCSTAAASFKCTVVVYSTQDVCPAYASKLGTVCSTPYWRN